MPKGFVVVRPPANRVSLKMGNVTFAAKSNTGEGREKVRDWMASRSHVPASLFRSLIFFLGEPIPFFRSLRS